jgi:hypothetical protein
LIYEMVTENITIGITFIAIIVGTIGNTWDKKKKGIKKLTATGWITIIIGIISCSIGLYKNTQNAKEIDWQEEQKKKVTKIAYSELNRVVDNLLFPFEVLWENFYWASDEDPTDLTKFYKDDNYKFEQLISKKFISQWDSVYITESPINPILSPNKPWWELFSNNAKSNIEDFNTMWLKFNLYYESETVIQISSIQRDTFFLNLLYLKDRLSDPIVPNGGMSSYTISWIFMTVHMEEYYNYIKKLKKLKAEAIKNSQ